jgi:hypothetical protein
VQECMTNLSQQFDRIQKLSKLTPAQIYFILREEMYPLYTNFKDIKITKATHY